MKAIGFISARLLLAIFAFISAFWLILLPTHIHAQTNTDKPLIAYTARLIGDDSRVRLLMEFDREPELKINYLNQPHRIVVDLPKTRFEFNEDDISARGLINDIRYGTMSDDASRIILSFSEPAILESSEQQALENGGHRLVLDISIANEEDFVALLGEQEWNVTEAGSGGEQHAMAREKNLDEFVIVLDPGHGGIDGGAEGRRGAIEKEVTLAFAKDLQQSLAQIGIDNLKLVLTREDDRFLSLSSRVRVARQERADLFISIHADSIRQRSLRGASIYTLSKRASDDVTRSLAEAENRTDVIAGLQIDNAPDQVTGILIDLARRETKVFSDQMADQIVETFNGEVRLINNPHRRAGFRVLQAPDVPSVLVELGFLSNPEDEKLLTNKAWRKNATDLLAAAIVEYQREVLRDRSESN